jgi:hypothetical protein
MEVAMKTRLLEVFITVAGLALFGSLSVAQNQKQEEDQQPVKQMKLTENQVQGFIAAQKQLAPLASKLEAAGDQPDPTLQKQVEQIAKSNGFATLDELDNVNANISLVLAGLDRQTGQFTEPPEMIKKEIDQLKQDKQMAQKDKDEAVADLQEALKTAKPLQFKENIAVVKKFQSDLDQAFPQEPVQK